jgi:hypothetical protein
MEDPEAGLEITVDLKVFRSRERFIRQGKISNPVTGKCPYLMAQVTKTGQVKGAIGKPDVVGSYPAPSGGFPADRKIGDINAFFFIDRRTDLVYDFFQGDVLLVWLLPDSEVGFKPFKQGLVVFGQGFFYFAGQGFQRIMKYRVFENTQKISAKIQGCQLSHGQWHRNALLGFQHEPQALAGFFFVVNGKPCGLEGFKIPVNCAGMALQPVSNVGNGFAGFGIDQYLKNFPLTS